MNPLYSTTHFIQSEDRVHRSLAHNYFELIQIPMREIYPLDLSEVTVFNSNTKYPLLKNQ